MVTASYRGNNFLTESHDTKGGRRLVIKELPGGEEPIVEDMGAKSGEFRLNAYFIGPDYDLYRDAFLLALNTPGADWLTHPWLVNLSDNSRGKFWVRARDWSVHESNDKGGYCTISIDFVPGGKDSPAPTIDRADAAAAAAQGLKKTVESKFKFVQQSMASFNSMVAKIQSKLDGVRNIIALAQLPLTMMSQIRSEIDGIKGEINALLALPAAYANAIRSFSDLLGLGTVDSGAAEAAAASSSGTSSTASFPVATTPSGIPVTEIAQVVDTLLVLTDMPLVSGGAGDSPALHINMAAESALFSQMMLASAIEVALADYQSADDRDAVLASVLKSIDRMLPSMDDDVFQATLDCRATLIDALNAQNLAPATQRDIVSPLPSTLLAHRMEVDEGVFLARNKVRHPLFVNGRVYG
jgi:prophage DNA circulation protein